MLHMKRCGRQCGFVRECSPFGNLPCWLASVMRSTKSLKLTLFRLKKRVEYTWAVLLRKKRANASEILRA